MSLRNLSCRLPIRLILAVVVLALAVSPLSATVMAHDDGGIVAADAVSPHDGHGPCHGGAASVADDGDMPCPNCGSPLHAQCTCCPCAAAFAIVVASETAPLPSHTRAPAAMGQVAALPRDSRERLFRPPIVRH
jgi:hypothetical protein